jgi:hypothetical protein
MWFDRNRTKIRFSQFPLIHFTMWRVPPRYCPIPSARINPSNTSVHADHIQKYTPGMAAHTFSEMSWTDTVPTAYPGYCCCASTLESRRAATQRTTSSRPARGSSTARGGNGSTVVAFGSYSVKASSLHLQRSVIGNPRDIIASEIHLGVAEADVRPCEVAALGARAREPISPPNCRLS